MDIEKLIERLKYYGTTYAIGDNLGKEVDGSDELMLNAATALSTLQAENEKLRSDLRRLQTERDALLAANRRLLAEREQLTAERDAAVEEVKHLKAVMRDEGIVVIPPKYPWEKSKWNV